MYTVQLLTNYQLMVDISCFCLYTVHMRGVDSMKGRIVSLLKDNYPEYISGEELSRILGVSRTAIWKHIARLREDGYIIESHSKVGYKLISSPDRPFEHELKKYLKANRIVGKDIIYHDVLDSTNILGKELAEQGAMEGTVIIAEKQTSGKGRLGRSWYSPAGEGLWFSVILRPHIDLAEVAKITLMAAVAVTKAIRRNTGSPVGIKWPNDILLNGKKLVGILTEMNAETDKINYLVIGIGVNINLTPAKLPPEINGIAVSLTEDSVKVSRINLLADILTELDSLYREFSSGNYEEILSQWRQMSVTLNRMVKIKGLNYAEEGFAVDIDDSGALLLKTEDGSLKRIYSGDVSLRT